MRRSQRCPKCSGRQFAVQQKLHVPAEFMEPLPAVMARQPTTFLPTSATHGHIEAWTCLGCGFTELYAAVERAVLERLARDYPHQLRLVDATPATSGPHR